MGKLTRTTAFACFTAFTLPAWSQATHELIDSTGRSVGQFAGDSALVFYAGQVVRIYTDAHWDYAANRPLSSGLTWKFVPIYYEGPMCTGQAYIGGSPLVPVIPDAPTPPAGPPYTSPAYGSHFLFAPFRVGTNWTAYISQENPAFQQVSTQSQRQYSGSCLDRPNLTVWATPVVAQLGLEIYGVPPFYVR